MNTLEGNKLIAEFMGWRYIADGDVMFLNQKTPAKPIDKLEFHSSWDWLIPVVEKIEELGFLTTIKYRNCADEGKYHEIIISKNHWVFGESLQSFEQIENAENYSKIQAVWNGVVNFIEKYNEDTSSLQST